MNRWLGDLAGTLLTSLGIGRATLDASALTAARTVRVQDSAGGIVPVVATSPPSSPSDGDLWISAASTALAAAPSADQNDYNFGDATLLAQSAILRLNPSANITLTGILATYDGHVTTIVNVSAFYVTLACESASSSAANRIAASATGETALLLHPGCSLTLFYDDTSDRWRPLGYAPRDWYIRQDATRTLTSQTTAQRVFGLTNGAIDLPVGTYDFEALVLLTSMSGTSGNATFSLSGGATLGSIAWRGFGRDVAADGATGTLAGSFSVDATLTAAPLVTAGTATSAWFEVKGTFEVTAAGTVILNVLLQTAAAAVVAIGSEMVVRYRGSTSAVSLGQWS